MSVEVNFMLVYFNSFVYLCMSWDVDGILLVEMYMNGGFIRFDVCDYEEFIDVFYEIGCDCDNKVVILIGVGDYMVDIDFGSFGNVGDVNVWLKVYDEGIQILENIVNICVFMIVVIEGKVYIYIEYVLFVNVIVVVKDVMFYDLLYFVGGIVLGDGVYMMWLYCVGVGWIEMFFLSLCLVVVEEVVVWGVVIYLVDFGGVVVFVCDLVWYYFGQFEVMCCNMCIYFIQLLKEWIVCEVGYGFVFEGVSVNVFVQQMVVGLKI